MLEQFFRLRKFNYNALVYNGYSVAYEAHNAKVVRYEQIRQPAFLLQLAHKVQHLRAYGYIQRAYGLVRYYKLRVHNKAARYAYALALSAGKLMRKTAGELRQQANIQQSLRHAFLYLLVAQVMPYVGKPFAHNIVNLCAFVKAGHRILEYHLDILYHLAVSLVIYLA